MLYRLLENNREIAADRTLDCRFFEYDLDIVFACTAMTLDGIEPISDGLRKRELVFEIRIDGVIEGAEEISSAE